MRSFKIKIASILQEKSTQIRGKTILVFRCIMLKIFAYFERFYTAFKLLI